MNYNCFLTILSVFIATLQNVKSSNILTIIVFPSYSHQQPLLALSEKLAMKGHNLTVLTTDPPKKFIPNYTSIDMSSAYEYLKVLDKSIGFNLQGEISAVEFCRNLHRVYAEFCDYELSLPQVKEFMRKAVTTQFDVVLIENLFYSSFQGLVHKLGTPPVVGVHTFVPWLGLDEFMGVNINPSFMPHIFLQHSNTMTFYERFYNTFMYWYHWYLTEYKTFPLQEKVLRKHFGADPPSVREMEYNKSLLLVPADWSISYPMNVPPNYIRTGTFHIQEPKPLPKDIQQWMDESENGAIYFSLGSNMQGTSVPVEKREILLKTFRKFPKIRFLWKYEAESLLFDVPSNVLIRKWYPQQSILSHPKCKVFFTQGGLQSTEEAIHYGVPLLVMPLFGDQPHQAAKITKEGAGLSLLLSTITEENLYSSINNLLTDTRFKSNMDRLSRISKDQMVPALDEAAWWVEYVIRHKGARHLRPQSLNMNLFQLQLLDVYGLVLTTIIILIYIVYKILRSIIFLVLRSKQKRVRKGKNKRS